LDVLDEHDLVKSTMQQLLDSIGSANGSTDVPSVITKHKPYDNDSLSLSKKARDRAMMRRHLMSLVPLS
jgi:hypothetical protein